MAVCRGTKRDGGACTLPATAGSPWCWNHDPARAGERRRNASRAAEEVYASVYKNDELSQNVCNVQVSAFQELQDKYGQTFSRRVYVTSMDKATASKVGDWLMVEQPAIWTVNKMHPIVEAELAQNAVEHAADCAEDEGIFDMQPLECP